MIEKLKNLTNFENNRSLLIYYHFNIEKKQTNLIHRRILQTEAK
jgi:hypothetical protein